ncbi:lysophospholipid acyltransferase family protein [Hippea sp. KM1]|uniref:lysophospholipid acyltransferase family protein n=1 Tax=Hippea sp. KM1 TaxID=944481 RepID=UPI00046CFF3D|nr:lysophospholipid acyltransferase family protein [Hippea sp. KM1]
MKIEAHLIYMALKGYAKTCKVSLINEGLNDYNKPVIFAFWHEVILFTPIAYDKTRQIKILQSTHKDGVLASMVINKFGLKTVWGSSNREPLKAFRSMLNEIKKGYSIGITPDGPKGPPRKLKKGILELAYLTKAPIVPVVGRFSSYFRINSWDRMIIPKPFSTVKYILKKPIFILKKEEFKDKAAQIEGILNESG